MKTVLVPINVSETSIAVIELSADLLKEIKLNHSKLSTHDRENGLGHTIDSDDGFNGTWLMNVGGRFVDCAPNYTAFTASGAYSQLYLTTPKIVNNTIGWYMFMTMCMDIDKVVVDVEENVYEKLVEFANGSRDKLLLRAVETLNIGANEFYLN